MQVLDGTVTLGREGPARLKARLYCRPSMIGAGVLTWVVRQRRTRMPERIAMQPERRTHKHCASCDLLSGSESTSARPACLWSTTPRGDTGMLAMDRHHPVNHGPPTSAFPPLCTPPDTEMIPACGRGHADNALEHLAEGAHVVVSNSHSRGVGLPVPLRVRTVTRILNSSEFDQATFVPDGPQNSMMAPYGFRDFVHLHA
jgi:hypothetical protein